ncbi:putative baseplate assembly protein [Crenobacter sp. SG2303]|uniref:Baseplate assembly protein n=1 Tax=Crenobacter oryzisoli TaxID=3056844 RepID=A0ABT7XRG1_9NEIS|nr:putative baseplate assembly protein [Crenobacter sp. SG2303]MDN0075082.1 putative baseplate assembly protein [Crenobacter sp. SG2303]MDN0076310.1 putative baseplate assembly protein [Crenobacter sp. SG2303]
MDENDDCGCCAGLEAETPKRLDNRPGLPSIAYRVGRHGDFRASLLARLSSTDFPALARLTARADDDFTIALCDAAATLLDVLSFYQERIANENFLRTASERRSILELARLVGYQLAPGVAASTWLAFSLQEAPGLPGQALAPVPVPTGTRVQSVPGPNEQPQTFETVETIEARATWNAMPMQTTIAWQPQRDDTDLYLSGVSTGLVPGDALLIVGQERAVALRSERWDVRIVAKVEPDIAQGITRVSWHEGLGSTSTLPAQDSPRVYVLRQRAAVFGYNAPDPRLMGRRGTALSTLVNDINAGAGMKWKNYKIGGKSIDLDAAYPKITANSWVVLVSHGADGSTSLPGDVELFRVNAVSVLSRTDFGLSGKVTRITLDGDIPTSGTIQGTLVLAQGEELAVAARPLKYPVFGQQLTFGSLQKALAPEQALALSGKLQRIGIAAQGLTLTLDGGGSPVPLMPYDSLQMIAVPLKRDGLTTVQLSPEELGASVGKAELLRLSLRDRDGAIGILDVTGDQIFLQPALEKDKTLAEIVFIDEKVGAVEHGRDGTTLHLKTATQHVYDRQSVRVNANVAPATHGETVNEILGSSTAGKPDQQFMLRQSPVTHVSASTASGRLSSLALRVNDLLWQEVPSLYEQGPNDRVFTTAIDDNGHTTVTFGDGIEGARPPSGQDNIRARYRKGIGAGGNVSAGKLGNLLTRPLGISGVTNPEPARGGQDAETMDTARANAPLTVLTLDRAVSVQDYEDFSRSFAGIAKAHATWIAAGPGRGVFVTVAGTAGEAVDESSAGNLLAALRRYGDALLPLRLANYRQATFRLRAAVKVAPDAETDMVLKRAEEALRSAFGFAARHFGQQVSVDEVVAVLHGVASVQAVNVIELYRPDQGVTPRLDPRLFARLPETSLTALPQAAELLTLDAGPLILEVMP